MTESVVLNGVIIQVETQLDTMRKEMQAYISRCSTEAKKMAEEIEMEVQNLSVVENEAAELLKVMPIT